MGGNAKTKIIHGAKNIFFIFLGTSTLAFGSAVFIVPFDIVAGGVSGLAIIIEKLLPYDIGTDTVITILTWGLFLIGFFALGRDFAIKTLLSSIFYPPLFSAFLTFTNSEFLGGYFNLAGSQFQDVALILAAICGGALVGIGCALSFIGGGSTGGVDIIAFAVCKFFPRLPASKVILAIDTIIVALGFFTVRNIILSLLGIVCAITGAMLIEKVFPGARKALMAFIISEKCDEINRSIIEKIGRTATLIDAVGGYSGEGKKLLMVTFSLREYSLLTDTVTSLDENAFITVYRAHEIHGEGWSR